MTTSIVPSLQAHSSIDDQPQKYYSQYQHQYQHCTLQWRRGQLLVKSSRKLQQPYLPALENMELLVDCLKHSPISLVTIDPKLGHTALNFWANACEQAKKPIFIRLPFRHQLLKPNNQIFRVIQGVIERILAFLLLILFSPLMLGLIILMWWQSPESLFSNQWHIGEKGKLFRICKFARGTKHNITPLDLWMGKYRLNNLPTLLNIIRGDISLFGYHFWSLEDIVALSLESQKQEFKKLPEILNSWHIDGNLNPAKIS